MVPDEHHPKDQGGQHQRHVTALSYLGQICQEETGINAEENARHAGAHPQAPTPDIPHRDKEQPGGQYHRGRYRDTVSGSQIIGLAKKQGQENRDYHQQPVHHSDIDLTVTFFRGLYDLQARQPAELNSLAGHRERSGNDRLAGDNGRDGRQDDERDQQRFRTQPVENVVRRRRSFEHQSGLASIVQAQTWKNNKRPGQTNRARAEMAHVGVKRFGYGYTEKNATQNEKAGKAV